MDIICYYTGHYISTLPDYNLIEMHLLPEYILVLVYGVQPWTMKDTYFEGTYS